MGRRQVSVHDAERWVFNRLAVAYRSRPGYPDALVNRLVDLAGGAGARVADLGAGTGHLSAPLAARGLVVAAVEPAAAMLAELVSASPGVAAYHAAAERTGLASGCYDLAIVADALHWIDPELAGREIARIVRPGGVCAVVEATLCDTPLWRALAALLARHNPKAAGHRGRSARQLLAIAAPKTAIVVEPFAQDVALSPDELSAVLRSLSYAGPALAPAVMDALIAEAQALAAEHGGATWSRTLTLSSGVLAALSPSRS